PLVVIIEDGHWLDRFSFNTISALLSSRDTARLLMVVSTREPRHLMRSFRHAERVHHLPLRPLSLGSTSALIADVLRPLSHASVEVVDGLVRAGNGNTVVAVS